MYVDSDIKALLARVKAGEIDFDTAMGLFPGAGVPEWPLRTKENSMSSIDSVDEAGALVPSRAGACC